MSLADWWVRLRQRKALRASLYASAGQLGGYALRLGSTIVLTRLLTPADYGLLAIAFATGVVLELMSDMGIRASIIRSEQSSDPLFLDTAWRIQRVRGLVLAMLTVLIGVVLLMAQQSGWLASGSAVAAPSLPWLIMLNALSPLILGHLPTKVYTANKELRLARIVAVDFFAQVGAVLTTLILAYATGSVLAAVAGTVFGCLLRVLFSQRFIAGRANQSRFDRAAARQILHFGRWVVLSSTLTALAFNGDRFLLAYWHDATVLGQYAIALTFITLINQLVGKVVSTVALPQISQAKQIGEFEFKNTVSSARRSYDVLCMTSAGLLFTGAPLLIHMLYDGRYQNAGPMLSILSFSLVLAREELYSSVYFATGKPQVLPLFSGLALFSLVVLVPIVHMWGGLQATLWMLALRHVLGLPVHYILMARFGLNRWQDEVLAVSFWAIGAAFGQCLTVLFR
ncbi:oligosaccharide flippase family protein [Ideonella sp.]|uniref:oligosaccharide flippase family protein n=1 Tax=Ideonella sp. TaxID=1929293 RepID=UPI003BB67901